LLGVGALFLKQCRDVEVFCCGGFRLLRPHTANEEKVWGCQGAPGGITSRCRLPDPQIAWLVGCGSRRIGDAHEGNPLAHPEVSDCKAGRSPRVDM
jgi:hypothetical protein